jgi:hypothetical protein
VNYDTLKIDRRIRDPNLELPEPALRSSDGNRVMIFSSINVFLTEVDPRGASTSISVSLGIECLTEANDQQQRCTDRQVVSKSHVIPP